MISIQREILSLERRRQGKKKTIFLRTLFDLHVPNEAKQNEGY